MNKDGCRVVQCLAEHCPESQVRGLVDALLREVRQIAMHAFGNYVVQNLLQYAADPSAGAWKISCWQKCVCSARIRMGTRCLPARVSMERKPSAKCWRFGCCRKPGLLVSMACMRHGHVAVLWL